MSPPEEHEVSIKQVVQYICKSFDFKNDIVYDTSYSDGQIKKTTNDHELKKYMGDFQFTTLENGINETVIFFKQYYDTIRK